MNRFLLTNLSVRQKDAISGVLSGLGVLAVETVYLVFAFLLGLNLFRRGSYYQLFNKAGEENKTSRQSANVLGTLIYAAVVFLLFPPEYSEPDMVCSEFSIDSLMDQYRNAKGEDRERIEEQICEMYTPLVHKIADKYRSAGSHSISAAAKNLNLNESDIKAIMEQNRQQLNEQLPAYEKIAEMEIRTEEFAKTPKRSIKRFLYQ